MRFVITGEWNRNRLLQTLVVLYSVYVVGAVGHERAALLREDGPHARVGGRLLPRQRGAVPLAAQLPGHARGGALPSLRDGDAAARAHAPDAVRAAARPREGVADRAALRVGASLDEGSGWLVRFASPAFAWLKIAGFLLLQGSLAALVLLSLWAVFVGSQRHYDTRPARRHAGRVSAGRAAIAAAALLAIGCAGAAPQPEPAAGARRISDGRPAMGTDPRDRARGRGSGRAARGARRALRGDRIARGRAQHLARRQRASRA